MAVNLDSLKGKNCVITGGSGVIGTAICEYLAEMGVNLAILDLDEDKASELAKDLSNRFGIDSVAVKANVLDKDNLIAAREQILSKFPKLDFLINGAGGNSPKATTQDEFITDSNLNDLQKTFFGLEIEGFQKVFDLNFLGTLLPSMVFGEHLVKNKDGAILNVSSMNAFRPLTKIPAYSAAKSSVNNFTEWLAVHFAKTNVRVNAVAPGFLLTNQNRFLLIDEETEELKPRGHKIIDGTPMGKFGDPEDVVGTIGFLLSDMSAFITGVTIPVDGGFNAYSGV